jgi:hypothetical protein
MSLLRAGLLIALVVGAGCSPGGPRRASDIQNLNGISDDIDAVRMTDSDTRHARDPNFSSTIPRTYEVHQEP